MVNGKIEAGVAPKKRGRPKGSGLGIKTGPRLGSRPWALANLQPGESMYLESPPGGSQRFMQQIATDIYRGGLQGKVTQTLILGVEPAARKVIELIRITRQGE